MTSGIAAAGVIFTAALAAIFLVVATDPGNPEGGPSTTVTTPGTPPSTTASTPLPALPPPDPQEVAATVSWENDAAARGAASSYQQTLDYELTFRNQQGETFTRTGTASLSRGDELTRVTVQPVQGDSLTVYVNATSGELFWCAQTECYSSKTTQLTGPIEPGSAFSQAMAIVNSVDAGTMHAALAGRTASNATVTTRQQTLYGVEYRCSWLEAIVGNQVESAKRCWSPQGQIVYFETTGQRVQSRSLEPGGPVTLPFALASPPSASV